MPTPALDQFAAFILTNGRPNNVHTYGSLRRHGYTGRIVVVVDDLDPTLDEYRQIYGDQVAVFDKRAEAARAEQVDNSTDLRAILYARNASFGIARSLGLRSFIQLDDDYNGFGHRFRPDGSFHYAGVKDLDAVFAALVRFHRASGATSVAMMQGGDYIGGPGGSNPYVVGGPTLARKVMNSFVCSVDREFQFTGRFNDDVNTYVGEGARGMVFLSTNLVSLNQIQSQQLAGGMSEVYKASGTYVKSFYAVIVAPSAVSVAMLRGHGSPAPRIHHRVDWDRAVPKILAESARRGV